MKRIILVIVIVLFAALGFTQEVVQDTVKIQKRIVELRIARDNITEEANAQIRSINYAIFELNNLIAPPKEEVEAEEPKKKKKK